MDVEFEQVEEGVGDKVEGAIDFGFVAVVEFERLAGLVADGEGNPFDFVFCIFNVLAGFSANR